MNKNIKLTKALDILAKWNITEIKIPTKFEVARCYTELFSDEDQKWLSSYLNAINLFKSVSCKISSLWDKNKSLVFFTNTTVAQEWIKPRNKEHCQILETIKLNHGNYDERSAEAINIASFGIPIISNNGTSPNDYSRIWDNKFCFTDSLCGFRVNSSFINNILQSDLYMSFCRRYIESTKYVEFVRDFDPARTGDALNSDPARVVHALNSGNTNLSNDGNYFNIYSSINCYRFNNSVSNSGFKIIYVTIPRDVSIIILNYVGSCSFRHYCEYILHYSSVLIEVYLVKKLLSDVHFPWGIHFNDMLDYLCENYYKKYYCDILYEIWFNRSVLPLDRYYQEHFDERTYTTSRNYMNEKLNNLKYR